MQPTTRGQRERGFTLVELMVVIAMIGILAGAAIAFVKPRSFAASSKAYTQEITALCESVHQRALASRKYQLLTVEDDQVLHYQALEPGTAAPTEWELVGTTPVPSEVVISAFDGRTHVNADDAVPDEGAGLPADIQFAPDGSATAATLFITDSADENRARVAIYRATGAAYTYYNW